MRAQADTAAGVQVGVAVDDQPRAVQAVQNRVQRRQFAQAELAGLAGWHLRHLPGAAGQQMAEGGIGGHDTDHSRRDQDAELEQLKREYLQWRIWHGHTTGDYGAMPPRRHPTARDLIRARDIRDLTHRPAGWARVARPTG